MSDLFYHIGDLNSYFLNNPEGHQYYEYQETDYQELPDDILISHATNILQDLDKGSYIYDVELVENTILSMCPDEAHWKANCFILRNPREITLSEIKKLIQNESDPHIHQDLPLVLSARLNNFEWVKYFHQECLSKLDAWDNLAIKIAKKNNCRQVLEYLIFNGGDLDEILGDDNDEELPDVNQYHPELFLLDNWRSYTNR